MIWQLSQVRFLILFIYCTFRFLWSWIFLRDFVCVFFVWHHQNTAQQSDNIPEIIYRFHQMDMIWFGISLHLHQDPGLVARPHSGSTIIHSDVCDNTRVMINIPRNWWNRIANHANFTWKIYVNIAGGFFSLPSV